MVKGGLKFLKKGSESVTFSSGFRGTSHALDQVIG